MPASHKEKESTLQGSIGGGGGVSGPGEGTVEKASALSYPKPGSPTWDGWPRFVSTMELVRI